MGRALEAAIAKAQAERKQNVTSRVWDALKVPEQKSREGLNLLAGMVPSAEPTGNVVRDVALNTPKILAESVAQVAPSFVSRGSLVTAGLAKGIKVAKPVIKFAGKQIAKAAEGISGLAHKTPEVLVEAAKDPTLFFGKGVDKANEIYASQVDPSKIRDAFKSTLGKKEFVEAAVAAVKDGSITPEEALVARQTLDSIKNLMPRISYMSSRELLNNAAKTKFAGADKAYKRAVQSEALRELLPMNKGGTPSKLLTALGAGGIAAAKLLNPYFLLGAGAVSPAVQGLAASTIGLGAKAASPLVNNPALGLVIPPAKRALEAIFSQKD